MDSSKKRVRFGYRPPPGIPQFLRDVGVKQVRLKKMSPNVQGMSIEQEYATIIINKDLSDFEKLLTLIHEFLHFRYPHLNELEIWENDTAIYRTLNIQPLERIKQVEAGLQLPLNF